MLFALVLMSGVALCASSQAQAGAPGTGSISGTISDGSGEPPLNACVTAYDSNGVEVKASLAHPPGQFKIDGLDPADYRLKFGGSCYLNRENNVLDEFYDDHETLAGATPVSVQADSNTAGIQVQLARGGSISGKVTNSSNEPVPYVCVEAYDSEGTLVRTGQTKAGGIYSMVGLPTDDYRIEFVQCGYRNNVVGEFYDNEQTLAQAEQIAVTAGSDTPDIDAELKTAGTISGSVTNSSGDPQDGIQVQAFDFEGNEAGSHTVSSSDGEYQIVGLATGEYRLEFSIYGTGDNVLGEFYGDKATLSEATPVSVSEGSDTPDIDAELATGGSVSGKISGSAGGGGAGFSGESSYCFQNASVYDSSGKSVGHSVYAGPDDTYKFERLPTGDYRVKFSVGCITGNPETGIIIGGSGASEYYKNKKTLAEATPVSVTAGSNTPHIDGVVGGPDGSISGTVTNSMGDPLDDICLNARKPNGSYAASAETDSNGEYKLLGLAAGDYQVKFELCADSEHNVLAEFYDNAETAAEATLVTVTEDSDTTGIDAELAKGGSISGTVSVAGGPLGYVCVWPYDSTGTRVRFGHTESDGSFTLGGLPSGNYRLQFHDCYDNYGQTIVPEFFDNVADLSEAVPIQVTTGLDAPDINAELARKPAEPAIPPVDDPPAEPVVLGASISKVIVQGPARVRKGEKVSYRVRITNSGKAPATGVKFRAKVNGITVSSSVGEIAAGSSRTAKVKLKLKKPGKSKLTFKVTSSNAGGKSVKRSITVRK